MKFHFESDTTRSATTALQLAKLMQIDDSCRGSLYVERAAGGPTLMFKARQEIDDEIDEATRDVRKRFKIHPPTPQEVQDAVRPIYESLAQKYWDEAVLAPPQLKPPNPANLKKYKLALITQRAVDDPPGSRTLTLSIENADSALAQKLLTPLSESESERCFRLAAERIATLTLDSNYVVWPQVSRAQKEQILTGNLKRRLPRVPTIVHSKLNFAQTRPQTKKALFSPNQGGEELFWNTFLSALNINNSPPRLNTAVIHAESVKTLLFPKPSTGKPRANERWNHYIREIEAHEMDFAAAHLGRPQGYTTTPETLALDGMRQTLWAWHDSAVILAIALKYFDDEIKTENSAHIKRKRAHGEKFNKEEIEYSLRLHVLDEAFSLLGKHGLGISAFEFSTWLTYQEHAPTSHHPFQKIFSLVKSVIHPPREWRENKWGRIDNLLNAISFDHLVTSKDGALNAAFDQQIILTMIGNLTQLKPDESLALISEDGGLVEGLGSMGSLALSAQNTLEFHPTNTGQFALMEKLNDSIAKLNADRKAANLLSLAEAFPPNGKSTLTSLTQDRARLSTVINQIHGAHQEALDEIHKKCTLAIKEDAQLAPDEKDVLVEKIVQQATSSRSNLEEFVQTVQDLTSQAINPMPPRARCGR